MELKKTSTWIIGGDKITKIQEGSHKAEKIKIKRGIIKDSKNCTSFKIMLDKKTGEVWCDQFSNNNDYKIYQEKNIVGLGKGFGASSINGWTKITLKDIERLAEYELKN